MVTAPEAAALLAVAAAFDNRKPDAHTARAWAEALHSTDFQDARTVIVEHYTHDHRWIMPSDVVKGVKALEDERITAAPIIDDLPLPDRLTSMEDGPEFNAAYLGWLQETHRRIRRGLPLEVGPEPVLSERQWTALVS